MHVLSWTLIFNVLYNALRYVAWLFYHFAENTSWDLSSQKYKQNRKKIAKILIVAGIFPQEGVHFLKRGDFFIKYEDISKVW